MSPRSLSDAPEARRTAWPLPAERLLLAAGTAAPERGLEAFRAWRRLRAGEIPAAERRLLPLAWSNLRHRAGEESGLAVARDAFHATWAEAIRRETASAGVLQALGNLGAPPVLLKGAALVASSAVPAGARPMSDIDVLVEPRTFDAARDFLLGSGFESILATLPSARVLLHSEGFRRADGFAFDLHAAAFASHRGPGADEPLFRRARAGVFAGAAVRIPAPEDHLLLLCWHGLHWSDEPAVHWAADAASLLRQAGEGFDWDVFAEETLRRRLAVPAARALRFLSAELGTSVPPRVLLALDAAPGTLLGRLECAVVGRPPSLAGGLLVHWLSHRRAQGPEAGAWAAAARFPVYLARMWGVGAPWRVPAEAVSRVRRRLRGGREARV